MHFSCFGKSNFTFVLYFLCQDGFKEVSLRQEECSEDSLIFGFADRHTMHFRFLPLAGLKMRALVVANVYASLSLLGSPAPPSL